MAGGSRRFEAVPVQTDRGHVRLPLPFDPREEWGVGARAPVSGTIGTAEFSGTIGIRDGGAFVVLNAGFRQAAGIVVGEPVAAELGPHD